VCKGNVGKPPGKFIWKKLRHGEHSPIIYPDVSTTSTEIQGGNSNIILSGLAEGPRTICYIRL
jgi:hypothetical protein